MNPVPAFLAEAMTSNISQSVKVNDDLNEDIGRLYFVNQFISNCDILIISIFYILINLTTTIPAHAV